MSSTQTIGLGTLFYYRGPSLPNNVNGGLGAETIAITIKNTSTGVTLIATVKIVASADASGS